MVFVHLLLELLVDSVLNFLSAEYSRISDHEDGSVLSS